MKMIIIGATLSILLTIAPASPQQAAGAGDRDAIVRRVAATATLAAQEYRIGVVEGRVAAPEEVEDARLFLEEARRLAVGLPADSGSNHSASLDSLLALVKRLGPPETLEAHQARSTATGKVLVQVRAEVDSAYAMARAKDPGASNMALSAYLAFEQIEREVRGKDASLAAELEGDFAALREAAARGAEPELEGARTRLIQGLDRVATVLGEGFSPLNLFIQSLVIMLREGLEAILIVGALMTFLAKMGAADRRRHVSAGIFAAIVASLLTALALETVFHLSPAHQEALEGLTMVVATAVLFYVSYWLLSKMEVVKWSRFVKSKVHDAVTRGSALALASAAFLAVYREGFETVLFYKALLISAGPTANLAPIVGGMLLGGLILLGVYIAMSRFGVRLPLKPFFAATSAFLYYMAFVFAGTGIHELQEGGFVPVTPVSGAPRIPAFGIYPTAETLGAQALLIALALVALVWTFVVEPRRALAAERRQAGELVA